MVLCGQLSVLPQLGNFVNRLELQTKSLIQGIRFGYFAPK